MSQELRELLATAEIGNLIADTHHTKDYAGRTHGFLRNAGEIVPVAAFVLGVEGVSQDAGRARLALAAVGLNALPDLLARIEALEAGLREIEHAESKEIARRLARALLTPAQGE